jgi:hypothetical protein
VEGVAAFGDEVEGPGVEVLEPLAPDVLFDCCPEVLWGVVGDELDEGVVGDIPVDCPGYEPGGVVGELDGVDPPGLVDDGDGIELFGEVPGDEVEGEDVEGIDVDGDGVELEGAEPEVAPPPPALEPPADCAWAAAMNSDSAVVVTTCLYPCIRPRMICTLD